MKVHYNCEITVESEYLECGCRLFHALQDTAIGKTTSVYVYPYQQLLIKSLFPLTLVHAI